MPSAATDALLELQDIDTDLDRHRHRRATFPERAELADAERRAGALATAAAEAATALAEVSGRQTALEDELAATEERITVVERRLYSGEVSAARDLQAMTADTKALAARRSDLEDRVLEVLDEREPHDERVAALVAERTAVTADIERLRTAIADTEATIDGELAELDAQRAGHTAAVPAELLATYEKIRIRLGGVGVARLVGSRCDGCHLTLPSAEVDRLRHLPDDAVATCEDCGRILAR